MRPSLHLAASSNWLNDPHGLVYWGDCYHVFYQHHPAAPHWGRMQWGHVSSPDLVTWTDHGPALEPSSAGPDRDGCWSGTVTVLNGVPTAYYTGAAGDGDAHEESVCRAVSDGDLTAWRKHNGAGVLSGEQRPGRRHQRDPFLVQLGDRWLMLLGSGINGPGGDDGGGAVIVYESTDLKQWHDRGVMFTRPPGLGPIDTGPVWEDPQLFAVGDQWVLIVSVQLRGGPDPICVGAVWFVGDLTDEGRRFAARRMGRLDGGDVFYAPAILTDPDGRRLAWAWLQDPSPDLTGDDVTVGALSLPRVLELEGDRLISRPAAELDGLASGEPSRRAPAIVAAGDGVELGAPPGGGAYRLRFTVEPDDRPGDGPAPDGAAGARLFASAAGGQALVVGLDQRAGERRLVVLDVIDGRASVRFAEALPTTGGPIVVDVIVDGTIVEAFAGGSAIAFRVDGINLSDGHIALIARGAAARFADIEAVALRAPRSSGGSR